MAKPNSNFKLDVKDINIIDEALILLYQQHYDSASFSKEDITELRAKIFHQKNWYVSKDKFQGGG